MTAAASQLNHPDLMIAIPAIRRQADQRWIVYLWRGAPSRVRFQYFVCGEIELNHEAEWSSQWTTPLPSEIPPRLKARAHRELRRLERHVEQPMSTPANRLTPF